MSILDKPYDPRGVANLMIEIAATEKIEITNLALQKILYFAHAHYLIENKKPLVSGYFEAWRYGPVHPVIYQSFKNSGDKPINLFAFSEDVMTGKTQIVASPPDEKVRRRLHQAIITYGRMTPGRLVEISHARGAPWHFIVSKASSAMAFGMRIPDDIIIQRFKYHKVALGAQPLHGEPGEDTPFASD